MRILFLSFIFLATVSSYTLEANASTEEEIVANELEQSPTTLPHIGFSFDLGGLFGLRTEMRDNESQDLYSLPEYGLIFGTHYQFLDKHSLGVWTGIRFGDSAPTPMISLGIDYAYGDKVDSWALGPAIGVVFDTPSILLGVAVFFRNWFIKPGFTYGRDYLNRGRPGFQVDLGYSFYFGS